MKISVIIPTYKPQQYFWECLNSLSQQTLAEDAFEVIVVLNGDKEPYNSDILSYMNSHADLNIQYIQTAVRGVSHARNLALNMASGEYIAFIDDDDFVSPYYLEELLSAASSDVVSLCYPLSFTDGTNEYMPYQITEDYLKNKDHSPCSFLKARRFFSGSAYKLIHRDMIRDKRFNCSFVNGEDSLFMFEISDAFSRVSFTSKKAIYYRRKRNGSALFRKKSFGEVFANCMRLFVAYSKIYFRHPFAYRFSFYVTRVLGIIHGAIEQYQLQLGMIK